MAGVPREHGKDKGFWDGGDEGNVRNNETAGRTSGSPGVRKASFVGVRTDIEFPLQKPEPKTK